MPAAHPLWPAMPVKVSATPSAKSPPVADGHVGLPAPQRPGADFPAFCLPHPIMATTSPHERMSNLMQQGIHNLFGAVAQHEIDTQLNDIPMVNAQSHGALAAVERERPFMQSMGSQQIEREGTDFLDSMRRLFRADEQGCQLRNGSRRGDRLRGGRLCFLTKFVHALPIPQRCLEYGNERRLNSDAVLLFDVGRQFNRGNIADFRNSKSEKFQRFHACRPGGALEREMYRQASKSVFREVSSGIAVQWRRPPVLLALHDVPPVRKNSRTDECCHNAHQEHGKCPSLEGYYRTCNSPENHTSKRSNDPLLTGQRIWFSFSEIILICHGSPSARSLPGKATSNPSRVYCECPSVEKPA